MEFLFVYLQYNKKSLITCVIESNSFGKLILHQDASQTFFYIHKTIILN